MIFDITSGIRNLSDSDLNLFARLILRMADRGHYIVMKPADRNWLDSQLLDTDKFYGQLDKSEYLALNIWDPGALMQRHLSRITIGDNLQADLPLLETILSRPSVVIVENGTYDWSAISRWIHLYRKKREYKDINGIINSHVNNGILIPGNAGGKDGIPNEARTSAARYLEATPYKLFSVFDSDKASANDSDKNAHIKAALDELSVNWHELKKRSIENYFPWDCFQTIGCVRMQRPAGIAEDDWDYLHIEKYINQTLTAEQRQKKYEKSMLVNLAEKLDKDLLRTRLEHIGEDPDEIQQIILKIAGII